jgi:hypothetical protein
MTPLLNPYILPLPSLLTCYRSSSCFTHCNSTMGEREGFRLFGVRPLYYLALFCVGLLFAFSSSLTTSSRNHDTPHLKARLVSRERGSLENAVATNYTEPPLFRLMSARDEEEDYTCSPDKPCSNGACCGPTGICGYGNSCHVLHLPSLGPRNAK